MNVTSDQPELAAAAAYDRVVAGLAAHCDPSTVYGTLASAVRDQARGAYLSSIARLEALGRSGSGRATERAFDHLVEMWRCEALIALERFDRAEAAADEHSTIARQHGLGWAVTAWADLQGRLAASQGRLDEAAKHLELAAQGCGTPVAATFAAGQVALRRGDTGPALQRALRSARTAVGSTAPEVTGLGEWFLAQHAGATGSATGRLKGLRLPRLHRDPLAEVAMTRLAVAASDRTTAARAAQAAAARARANPTVPGFLVAARHSQALLDHDAATMREVVSSLTDRSRPLMLGEALGDLADLAAPGERIAILEAALAQFVSCGAMGDARTVRQRLDALGSRRRPRRHVRPNTGWDALTTSERTVTRLVARGLTNQAVADELIVSPHTVSSHLRSSFRKLDVSSRTQLARLVVERERGSQMS